MFQQTVRQRRQVIADSLSSHTEPCAAQRPHHRVYRATDIVLGSGVGVIERQNGFVVQDKDAGGGHGSSQEVIEGRQTAGRQSRWRSIAALRIRSMSWAWLTPCKLAMMTKSLDRGFNPGSGLISRKYGTPSRSRKSIRATSRQPRTVNALSAASVTASWSASE